MTDKNKIKEELKEISPFLASLKKESSFNIPKDYFKELPDEILKQVQEDTSKYSVKFPSLFEQFIQQLQWLISPPRLAGLATVVLLVGGFIFMRNQDTYSHTSEIAVSEDEINSYIAANIEDFEEDLLLEFTEDNDLSNLFQNIEEEDLDKYLENELDNIDLEILEDYL